MDMNLDHDQFEKELRVAVDEIETLLKSKNRAYGDAALNPIRVFSKADPIEQLKVRIDDKLSRLARGTNLGEDVILDLLGYMLIYRIQMKRLVPYDM